MHDYRYPIEPGLWGNGTRPPREGKNEKKSKEKEGTGNGWKNGNEGVKWK